MPPRWAVLVLALGVLQRARALSLTLRNALVDRSTADFLLDIVSPGFVPKQYAQRFASDHSAGTFPGLIWIHKFQLLLPS